MASYNGNIDLLSLNGAQVLKGIDAKNPERVSLPMWECGLKLTTLGIAGESLVTPHVGVWIETPFPHSPCSVAPGHSPRGSVD